MFDNIITILSKLLDTVHNNMLCDMMSYLKSYDFVWTYDMEDFGMRIRTINEIPENALEALEMFALYKSSNDSLNSNYNRDMDNVITTFICAFYL